MSVWKDIDALKAKFDQEMAEVRAAVEERCDKRARNSVCIVPDGRWRVLWAGKERFARTSAELLAQLPPSPRKRPGMA